MKKKAIKYTIFLLILPLIVSIIIAITTDGQGFENTTSNNYNALDIPNYSNNTSNEYEIKNNNTFTYFSVITLVVVSSGVWLYIKKKRGF